MVRAQRGACKWMFPHWGLSPGASLLTIDRNTSCEQRPHGGDGESCGTDDDHSGRLCSRIPDSETVTH